MPRDYSAQFYANQSTDSYRAARVMLPTIFELVHPDSVVDVGCGVGTWLAAAGELGARKLVGYEGDWVEVGMLRDRRIELRRQDLEQPIASTERFDLAMSLEVAEHLSAGRADSLVDDLCRLSERVLFSAAVPGQGGVNHINEQWQDYWAEAFERRGYRPLDIVRPAFWSDHSLPVHYRQNMFLYVSPSAWDELQASHAGTDLTPTWPLNVVHPDMHMDKLRERAAPPTLPAVLRSVAYLPLAVVRSVRARLP